MSVSAKRRSACCGLMVCLAFTGAGVAAADPPQITSDDPVPVDTGGMSSAPRVTTDQWVDDPYQPHVTRGALLRFGTAVGQLTNDQRNYAALGPVIAVGRRAGRFWFDAEYTYLSLRDAGAASMTLGRVQNFDLVARFDVLRLGSRIVGGNSMAAFYAEGAVQRSMYHFDMPSLTDPARVVPGDSSHTQGVVGFGFLLDHRVEQPHGLSRVGWQLGWRLATSPRDNHDPIVVCRGCIADVAQPAMTSRIYDTEMIVTSTLDFTW